MDVIEAVGSALDSGLRGDHPAAVTLLDLLGQRLLEPVDPAALDVAEMCLKGSAVLRDDGQLPSAYAGFGLAREVFTRGGLEQRTAECDHEMGMIAEALGDDIRATRHYDAAHDAYQRGLHQAIEARPPMSWPLTEEVERLRAESEAIRVAQASQSGHLYEHGVHVGVGRAEVSRLLEDLAEEPAQGPSYMDPVRARCLLARANAAAFRSERQEAARLCEEARGVFVVLGMHGWAAECDMSMGGRSPDIQTVLLYGRAREAYVRLGSPEHVAFSHLMAGRTALNLGEDQHALDKLALAAQGYLAINHKERAADCYWDMGGAAGRLRDLPLALRMYARAHELYEAVDADPYPGYSRARQLAICYTGAAQAATESGDHELALELYGKAVDINEEAGLHMQAAQEAKWMATIAEHMLADLPRAMQFHIRAGENYALHEVSAEPPQSEGQAASQFLSAERIALDLGQFARALDLLERVRAADTHEGTRRKVAAHAMHLGTAALRMGDLWLAGLSLTAARDIYEGLRMFERVAACDLELGSVAHEQGDSVVAAQRYEMAREVYSGLGMDIRVADCDHRMSTWLRSRGNLDPAEELLEAARDTYERREQPWGLPACDLSLAFVAGDRRDLRRAEQLCKAAQEAYIRLKSPRDAASCQWYLGNLATTRNRYREAEQLLVSARSTYQKLGLWRETARIDIGRAENLNYRLRAPGVRVEDQFKWAVRALDLVVPALLALDTVRFELAGQATRARWTVKEITPHLELALGLAWTSADAGTFAALIETTRAFGRTTLGKVPEADEIGGALGQNDQPEHHVGPYRRAAIVLQPSAALLMPNGRIALDSYHTAAESRYGRITRLPGKHAVVRWGSQPGQQLLPTGPPPEPGGGDGAYSPTGGQRPGRGQHGAVGGLVGLFPPRWFRLPRRLGRHPDR